MDTGTDLELFKAKVQAELNRLEAQSSAKDVAGKAIGKDGLKYITVIVVIGVASSLLKILSNIPLISSISR